MNSILLGTTELSMLRFNPDTEWLLDLDGKRWKVGRTGSGRIMLRSNGEAHPEFLLGQFDGMELGAFCYWVNSFL